MWSYYNPCQKLLPSELPGWSKSSPLSLYIDCFGAFCMYVLAPHVVIFMYDLSVSNKLET